MPETRRRFLFAVWPYSGHVNPCLAVANALRDRGHEVAFFTGEMSARSIESEGHARFPFVRVAARLSSVAGEHGGDAAALYATLTARYTTVGIRNPLAKLARIRRMYSEMLAGTVSDQVEDLADVYARWSPDVVIADPMMWGAFAGLPQWPDTSVAAFSFFAGCLLPGPEVAPPGLGLPPPRSWWDRLCYGAVSRMTDVLAADMRAEINRVRQRHGLPPFSGSVAELTGRAAMYMVATSPDYDYNRHDLPNSVQYVGPCLWDKNPMHAAPEWIQNLPADKPVVYVTEGTAQVQRPRLLPAAAEGLADLPIHVVMTTGSHRKPSDMKIGAPNVEVHSWVAHSDLFPKLSVVVTSGGSSTVRGALAAGIPLVVVPMEWDQQENAQRIAESGAGVRLRAGRCDPKAVRAAVERVLGDPSFAANARRLAASFVRYGGGDRAVELLEQLARRRPVNSLA